MAKVAVISASTSRLAGGLFYSVRALSKGLSACGEDVGVFSLSDSESSRDAREWEPLRLELSPIIGPRAIGYSPALQRAIEAFDPDVIHSHGLWQYSSCVANRRFRSAGTPYILSPRGMLDPWAVRNSGLKKKLAAGLYESRNMSNAACMHALNRSEARSIREYGLKQAICVLPNGVNLPSPELLGTRRTEGGKKRVVFIGRIHPKKGIREMLDAWAKVQKEFPQLLDDVELIVAGWDDGGYLEALKQHASDLGLLGSVSFPGSVYGDAKIQLLCSADWFVLPSHSEGMPMAVLEAWSYSVPALLTPACNLPEGFSSGSAIRVDPSVESIFEGFLRMLEMPKEESGSMGLAARRLVEDHFTWSQISRDMQEVYRWVRGEASAPECLFD